jgi:aldose 1-epimerase
MGFPGTLDVWVTYRLRGATLGIDIRAKTDATTLCNITGHSYFNFTGAPTIADHQLQVAASQILQVDETGIPSGAKMNVTGTQFDFQTPAALTQGDHRVMIDHNYCVSDDRMEMRPIAWLSGAIRGWNWPVPNRAYKFTQAQGWGPICHPSKLDGHFTPMQGSR